MILIKELKKSIIVTTRTTTRRTLASIMGACAFFVALVVASLKKDFMVAPTWNEVVMNLRSRAAT